MIWIWRSRSTQGDLWGAEVSQDENQTDQLQEQQLQRGGMRNPRAARPSLGIDTDSEDEHDLVEIRVAPLPQRQVLLRLPTGLTQQQQIERAAARLCAPAAALSVVHSERVRDMADFLRQNLINVLMTWSFRPNEPISQMLPETWTIDQLAEAIRRTTPVINMQFSVQGVVLNGDQVLAELPVREILVTPQDDLPGERGGARGDGGEHERRSMMISWAVKKAQEDLPDFDVKVLRMLVRSENRVPNAILNAKSKEQVRHVLEAACRRNGLHRHARELQRQAEQQEEEPSASSTAAGGA